MLKHGILGLLNYGDMTGYEIMTAFRDSLNHFWVAQTSQIYRELQVLEKNGWIISTHVEQEGRPDKNVLSITKEGRRELKKWLTDDAEKKTIRSPMLMKTFFRGECSIDENIDYFTKLRDASNLFPKGQNKTVETAEYYSEMIDDPMKALYWKFTIEFGMMYNKLLVEWCDGCIKELEGIRDAHSSGKRKSKGKTK